MPDVETCDLYWENGALFWRGASEWEADDYSPGIFIVQAGQTREAIQYYREAIRLHPDSFCAYYHLIAILMNEQTDQIDQDQSFWEDVWRLCNHALTLENSHSEHWIWILGTRGYAECQLDRFKDAIATMRAIIDASPEDRWAYETLQQLQFRTWDWIGSMRTTKALASIPNFDASYSLSTACKRRLAGIALGAVGGVLLIRHLRRRR